MAFKQAQTYNFLHLSQGNAAIQVQSIGKIGNHLRVLIDGESYRYAWKAFWETIQVYMIY